jgi:hypothetical protein
VIQPGGRIQANPDLQMPHVHQASASIERPLGANLRMMASYQMLQWTQPDAIARYQHTGSRHRPQARTVDWQYHAV